MNSLALLILLALPAPAAQPIPKSDGAAPKPPVIRFPDVVPNDTPKVDPVPTPKPNPAAPVNIPADEIYVIDSDVELNVLCSPADLVAVTLDPGPLPIRAKFVGGKGLERRNFAGKFVYSVEAKTAGSGELIVFPASGPVSAKDIVRKLITTLNGPQPPPKPVPDDKTAPAPKPKPPTPVDPPTPEPIVTGPLFVVTVTESSERTPAEAKLIADTAFWAGLGHDFRHYDKDDASAVKGGYTKVYNSIGSCLVVVKPDGTVVFKDKLPGSTAEVATILKKLTGK